MDAASLTQTYEFVCQWLDINSRKVAKLCEAVRIPYERQFALEIILTVEGAPLYKIIKQRDANVTNGPPWRAVLLNDSIELSRFQTVQEALSYYIGNCEPAFFQRKTDKPMTHYDRIHFHLETWASFLVAECVYAQLKNALPCHGGPGHQSKEEILLNIAAAVRDTGNNHLRLSREFCTMSPAELYQRYQHSAEYERQLAVFDNLF